MTVVLPKPRFERGQAVRFVGGSGVIKNYQYDAGAWAYLIEMTIDSDSDVRRIGSETPILLPESELTP